MPLLQCCWYGSQKASAEEGQRASTPDSTSHAGCEPENGSHPHGMGTIFKLNSTGQADLASGWPVPVRRPGPSASAPLAAAGLDVEHQQEHRWNQDEHQAGDKAEIVGFHGIAEGVGRVSPANQAQSRAFTRRCAGVPRCNHAGMHPPRLQDRQERWAPASWSGLPAGEWPEPGQAGSACPPGPPGAW
jgi:hypothetical protein